MLDLIYDYQKSRKMLCLRIEELKTALKNPALSPKEQKDLFDRKKLLAEESLELLHIIREMQMYLTEEEQTVYETTSGKCA